MAVRGKVTVYTGDVRRPPLVDSPDVDHILIRDEFGDPMILVMRLVDGDVWGLSNKGDPDFYDNLLKYGLVNLKPGVTPMQVIKQGLSQKLIT